MSKAEQAHKDALVELGCILCHRLGLGQTPPELHHLRTGGWGKGGYKTLMPLCFHHHRGIMGIHTLGTKAFERVHGVTQRELLAQSLEMIGATA
jgi:hypothetical protein